MTYIGDHKKGEIEIIMDANLADTLVPDKVKPLGVVYSDPYIRIQKDPVLFPNGTAGAYIRLVPQKISLDGHAGSAVIGVVDGKILLINMFRHALRQRSLEIPRGFSEGDSDLSTALREVEEETGYTPDEITLIGHVHPDSGLTSSKVALYYANLNTKERGKLDGLEAVGDQSFYTLDDIKTMIHNGTITDSFTLAALAMAMVKGFIYL